MLALCLAAVLSAAPPAAEAWALAQCPRPKQRADTNTALRVEQRERVECLRKAMKRELDRVILPLKRSRPEAFSEWMALQGDYDRWVTDACTVAEEANWVDLSTGERSIGTGYGLTESLCLQRQFAWRGFSAAVWARGDWNTLHRLLRPLAEPAHKARQQLEDYRTRVQQTAAHAPAQVAALPTRQLSREEWRPYTERLERVASGPEALAHRQCGLFPKAPPECVPRFADSLVVQISLSEVLGEPRQDP